MALSTAMSPCIMSTRMRPRWWPRPVPPNSRDVDTSACVDRSKRLEMTYLLDALSRCPSPEVDRHDLRHPLPPPARRAMPAPCCSWLLGADRIAWPRLTQSTWRNRIVAAEQRRQDPRIDEHRRPAPCALRAARYPGCRQLHFTIADVDRRAVNVQLSGLDFEFRISSMMVSSGRRIPGSVPPWPGRREGSTDPAAHHAR